MSNRKKDATITSIGARLSPVKGPVIGWIASIAPQDIPCVDYEGNKAGPLPARCLMALMSGSFASMAERRQEVLLVFERNDPRRPIITGFFRPSEMEEVVIEARDGVALVCGEGAVALRRNGRVFVSGTDVTVDSRGVVRVRGADTEIS